MSFRVTRNKKNNDKFQKDGSKEIADQRTPLYQDLAPATFSISALANYFPSLYSFSEPCTSFTPLMEHILIARKTFPWAIPVALAGNLLFGRMSISRECLQPYCTWPGVKAFQTCRTHGRCVVSGAKREAEVWLSCVLMLIVSDSQRETLTTSNLSTELQGSIK